MIPSALLSTLWTMMPALRLGEFLRFGETPALTVDSLAEEVESPRLRKFLRENPEWWRDGETILNWIMRRGARLTWPGREDYPAGLFLLEDPPQFLSYFGSPCWCGSRLLSVVGSREPATSSVQWIEQNLGLLPRDITIVSGGARGVDQRAHASALRRGLPTLAFLPSGLAKPYPPSFEEWVEPIVRAGGAVMTELAPACEMRKHYFLRRNRMIAAIAPVTLIVEARRQSGTMITARRAQECGREVAVIPGPVQDARWSGSLELLFEHASPIRDAVDLRSLLDLRAPLRPVFAQEHSAENHKGEVGEPDGG